VVPATFERAELVTSMRADPTGSLARATREALAALGVSSTSAADASPDLDAALRVALGR
jgi:hypothetical protein